MSRAKETPETDSSVPATVPHLLPDTKNNPYSESQVELFLAKVRNGLPLQVCATLSGINPSTLAGWLVDDDLDESALEVRKAVQKAESDAQERFLDDLDRLGEKSWQARAWRLERRWPQSYGQRQQATGDTGPRVAIIIGDVSGLERGKAPTVEVIEAQALPAAGE